MAAFDAPAVSGWFDVSSSATTLPLYATAANNVQLSYPQVRVIPGRPPDPVPPAPPLGPLDWLHERVGECVEAGTLA